MQSLSQTQAFLDSSLKPASMAPNSFPDSVLRPNGWPTEFLLSFGPGPVGVTCQLTRKNVANKGQRHNMTVASSLAAHLNLVCRTLGNQSDLSLMRSAITYQKHCTNGSFPVCPYLLATVTRDIGEKTGSCQPSKMSPTRYSGSTR